MHAFEHHAGAPATRFVFFGQTERSPLLRFIEQLQALAPYPVRPVVRTVDHDTARIKQLLDGGAQTLMVPMVESALDAEQLVRAMRYPPEGIRGLAGMSRGSKFGTVPDYAKNANKGMGVIVQLETPAAVAQLEAIAAVPGVDAIFLGPGDLSASLAPARRRPPPPPRR